MNNFISKTTTLVDQILSTNSIAYVHSVYNNTINLQTNEYIIAIQSPNTLVSPVSILSASPISAWDVVPELSEECRLTPETLYFPKSKLSFSLDIAKRGVPTIHTSHPCSLSELNTLVISALNISKASGFHTSPEMLSFYHNILSNCAHAISSTSYEAAADSLVKLLGLGIGLTPSGDDFLCGFLYALSFTQSHRFHSILSTRLLANLDRTNDISGNFVKLACNQYFHEALLQLPHQSQSSDILNTFSSIGHTSGIDMLTGVKLGLEFVKYYCSTSTST